MVSTGQEAPPVMTTRRERQIETFQLRVVEHGDERGRCARDERDAFPFDQLERRTGTEAVEGTARAPAMMACRRVRYPQLRPRGR